MPLVHAASPKLASRVIFHLTSVNMEEWLYPTLVYLQILLLDTLLYVNSR